MDIYGELKSPPENALKPITGGRLKGKSDINPQWRTERMTEVFGPIGFGWKWEMRRREIADCGNERLMFIEVALYVKDGDVWSEPIIGLGGSHLLEEERAGLHANDEAEKMACTDALSYAMKQLGMAADIYRGIFDGKYPPPTGNAPKGNGGNPGGRKPNEVRPELREERDKTIEDCNKIIAKIRAISNCSVEEIIRDASGFDGKDGKRVFRTTLESLVDRAGGIKWLKSTQDKLEKLYIQMQEMDERTEEMFPDE